MRQLAPDLLLYPISDVGEALARVPHREVVDPPPQHWINQAYRLITLSIGCDRCRRNTCLSSRSSAVRFFFSTRVHPGSTDPVNILLNVTANLLARDITVALDRAGLHPGFGALHATEEIRSQVNNGPVTT